MAIYSWNAEISVSPPITVAVEGGQLFGVGAVAYPRGGGGGPEGPRTLPWLQAGPCFSPSGARFW